jgi:hypothetical protein
MQPRSIEVTREISTDGASLRSIAKITIHMK